MAINVLYNFYFTKADGFCAFVHLFDYLGDRFILIALNYTLVLVRKLSSARVSNIPCVMFSDRSLPRFPHINVIYIFGLFIFFNSGPFLLLLLLLFLSVCTNNIISNTHDLNIYSDYSFPSS